MSFDEIDLSKLSPMMKQYASIKSDFNDTILMYRIGDFYEMFFDDALEASKVLGIALTGRDCGLENRAPMCGVPHHAALTYVKKLIDNNYKVAICEQLEDPANTKTLVKRGITKIYTPGTIIESEYLNDKENNFLLSIFVKDKYASISYCDISTGELFVSKEFRLEDFKSLYDEVSKVNPKEVLINEKALFDKFKKLGYYCVLVREADFENVEENITKYTKIRDDFIFLNAMMKKTLLHLFAYLFKNKNVDLEHFDNIKVYEINNFLELDETALRNLELTKNITDNTKKGSLLSILDKTTTSKGARKLKYLIERPLKSQEEINYRLNIVEDFYNNPIAAQTILNLLNDTFDIERIASKIAEKSVSPQELNNLKNTLLLIPKIKEQILSIDSDSLDTLANLDLNKDVLNLIINAIDDEPSISINAGFVIKEGYSEELDRIRHIKNNLTGRILDYENHLKEKSDIKNLRIKYNKVAGYYIEVSKGQIDKVPAEFERTQTLKNVERYKTKELREIEYESLNSTKMALYMEKEIYIKVLSEIVPYISDIKKLAEELSYLDVFISFSIVARENRYVKPVFNSEGKLLVEDGRHPVIEAMNNLEDFIPNDVNLDENNKIAIITGPNMSGKSTYMRMIALIQIMAQIGSFVPAKSANLCIMDKVFTRIGASDSLFSGKSTFMVEMSEVSYILKNATKNSLVILDEVGRGTGTFDGMAIAKAVIYYISLYINSYTLFSTHYQELSVIENDLNNVINLTLEIKDNGKDIMFLRKIKHGVTSKSYGIHVAKLAGLPNEVIIRARKFQENAENNSAGAQLKLFDFDESSIKTETQYEHYKEAIEYIESLDINSMTPLEALQELDNIKKKVMK